MIVRNNGQLVADIPANKLADEAPVYERESREPAYLQAVRAFTLSEIPDTQNPIADLKSLLSWPTIASKNWIYRQYDQSVRAGTIICPGSDAAVIRIKEDSLPALPNGNFAENGDSEGSSHKHRSVKNFSL
jgi:phosphoribosylformylglycinamidine synthase